MPGAQARLIPVLGRYDVPDDAPELDVPAPDDVPSVDRHQDLQAPGPDAGIAAGVTALRKRSEFASIDAWRQAVRERTQTPEPVLHREAPQWNCAGLAGRLTELTGGWNSAVLTAAVDLVADAQQRQEPVAWIGTLESGFYPPDAAGNGVDLDALAVVRVPDTGQIPRAADQLARSGAFGLLILDLGTDPHVPTAQLSRLLGLAQKHETAIVCLSQRTQDGPSLDSLVSLRAEAVRERQDAGVFECRIRVRKDKRHAPGWGVQGRYRAPAGIV